MAGQIIFIGGGNMAASLIGGLLADGRDPRSIRVVEPVAERRDWLAEQFSVETLPDSAQLIPHQCLVVLAVKPQILRDVCLALADRIDHASPPVILSIAAGIRTDALNRWLDVGGIIRAMPNTPAMVRAGATGLYANPSVSADDRASAESVMRAVGITCWVPQEADLDTVTALSGSGPAYAFYLIEAMQKAAIARGLDERTAGLLAVQTVFGAAKLALESNDDAATLRQQVTSPNGTTEKAIQSLQDADFENIVQVALTAAAERSVALADELGRESGRRDSADNQPTSGSDETPTTRGK